MNKKRLTFGASLVCKLVVSALLAGSLSTQALAELKELNDKKLKDQTAKAGITIDLETQLSIGEMYLDMRGNAGKEKARKNYMPEPVAPITYDVPKGR